MPYLSSLLLVSFLLAPEMPARGEMGKGISMPSCQISFTMEQRTRGRHGVWVQVECRVADFRTLAGRRGLEELASGELDSMGTVDPLSPKPQGNTRAERRGVQ